MEAASPGSAMGRWPNRAWDISRLLVSAAVALAAGLCIAAIHVAGLSVDREASLVIVPFAAVLAYRHPAATTTSILILLGFAGTIAAFTPLPVRASTDAILLSLWIVVAARYATGDRRPVWVWPALAAPLLYLLLSLLQAIGSPSLADGLEAARLGVWPMLALFAVAVAGFSDRERDGLAKGAVVAGILVGLYAVYRWIVGPAPEEEAIARAIHQTVAENDEIRFFGSSTDAESLSFWCAAFLAFTLSLSLTWRGGWRLAAICAAALCAFCVLASEVRTGTVAAVVGVALVVLLFTLARAYPSGRRIGTTLGAVLVLVVAGLGIFSFTVGDSEERVDRFERIFDRDEDAAFTARQSRWDDTWPEVEKMPFGHGLGTVGVTARQSELRPETVPYIDSSYIKIAYEQGVFALVLFALVMILLLGSVALRAVGTGDPRQAAPAIGACGVLAAALVFFYTGEYIESSPIMAVWLLAGIGIAQLTSPRSREPGTGASPA